MLQTNYFYITMTNAQKIMVRKPKGKRLLVRLSVDGRKTLKLILKEGVRAGLGSRGSTQQ
jgi:hypothetical protein